MAKEKRTIDADILGEIQGYLEDRLITLECEKDSSDDPDESIERDIDDLNAWISALEGV